MDGWMDPKTLVSSGQYALLSQAGHDFWRSLAPPPRSHICFVISEPAGLGFHPLGIES